MRMSDIMNEGIVALPTTLPMIRQFTKLLSMKNPNLKHMKKLFNDTSIDFTSPTWRTDIIKRIDMLIDSSKNNMTNKMWEDGVIDHWNKWKEIYI